jgi:hypothetical protein
MTEEENHHFILPKEKFDEMVDKYANENDECQAYKQALKDILLAPTVGKMVEIANKVLKENSK